METVPSPRKILKFEILCDGNLEWVPSSQGKRVPNSVHTKLIGIGKTEIDGEIYIGKVVPGYFFIPYKWGEACIGNYLQLIEKNLSDRKDRNESTFPDWGSLYN